MKNKIKYLFYIILSPTRFLIFLSQKRIIRLSDEKHLKLQYKSRFNKKLDLNNPKTFNEKLQWLKIHDRKSIYTKMCDKYEVKKYVSSIIGEEYIIPTLGVFDKFDDIDFNKMPDSFVIKCTHDSGGIIIVKDKNFMDVNNIRKTINKNLKKNYYWLAREWPYKDIVPRIIIEPLLVDDKYQDLRDYKYYIFNNKHVLSFVCSDRCKKVKYTFFNKEGKFIDIKQCGCENDRNVSLPYNYKKMIELAEKLSKNTIQVRVDFYEVNGKIFFGELTFFDSSGFGMFEPEKFDLELGKKLKLK